MEFKLFISIQVICLPFARTKPYKANVRRFALETDDTPVSVPIAVLELGVDIKVWENPAAAWIKID
jgi:hypothetical protein